MNKDSFELEKELTSLEKEMKAYFEKIEQPLENENFKGNLREKLEGIFDSHNMKEKKEKKKWFMPGGIKLALSFGVFVVMFGVLFFGLSKLGLFMEQANAEEVSIVAAKQSKMGVDANTSFILKSDVSIDEKSIRNNLRIKPDVDYTLEKEKDGKEYKIIPEKTLEYNTIYRFTFAEENNEGENNNIGESNSWAFQTKGNFNIVGSLPNDKSSGVPTNTGIEIMFSHEYFDLKDFEAHFTISPSVEGRFEKHKKTAVFIPNSLSPMTIYTVKLKQGLSFTDGSQAIKEDYTFSFETALKDNNGKKHFSFDMDSRLTQFSTTEVPIFSAYCYMEGSLPKLNIKLYSYPDHTSFIKELSEFDKLPPWSYYALKNYKSDTSTLTKVAEYNTEFMSVNDYQRYIVFPNTLKPGDYLAEVVCENEIRQMRFQVTDLSAYLTTSKERGIIWVNDLVDKNILENTSAKFISSGKEYKGNKDGVIFINDETLNDVEKDYAIISSKNKSLVLPVKGKNTSNENTIDAEAYWKYVYIDREIYQPDDEIKFWGIIAPRHGGERIDQVKVELVGYDRYYSYGENKGLINETSVKVKGNVFEGSLKIPNIRPGYYCLKVKYKDVVLKTHGFSVETYKKPAYKITIEENKKAIFAGEKMNFDISASFFEGTPVSNLSFNYQIGDKRGKVVTSENGTGSITYTGKANGGFSSFRRRYVSVTANLPEAGEIWSTAGAYVFNSKVYIKGEAKRENENYSLNIDLFNIDLSKINEGLYPSEDNFINGPATGKVIKGSLYEDIWEKIESGESYDFIEKKVVKRYYHRHSSKLVEEFSITSDELGKATYQGVIDPDKTYYIEVNALDDEGRTQKSRFYLRQGHEDYTNSYKYYYLKDESGKNNYVPGDNVKLTMMEGEKAVTGEGSRFLYYTGQYEIDTYKTSSEPYFEFAFTQNNIPNINVYGVYFDGYTYQNTGGFIAAYNKEMKKLNVELTTDKDKYRPGEKVKLSMHIKDKNDKPVQGILNLNLVDEALYSLQEQRVDLLSSLYNDFIFPYLYTIKSHYHPEFNFGAECGGEGDSERKDFRDTVLFTTLNSDSNGKASTEFVLPDNLTSWRLTYHAVTKDLKVDSGTEQIPVSLPFFINLVNNDIYLLGDSPVIVLRSFGEKLLLNANVKYEMKLITPKGEEISTAGETIAKNQFDWQLPSLKEQGKYTFSVKAVQGDYRDAVKKEFMVVPSLMEKNITTYQTLTEDTKLSGSDNEATTIMFSDYERSQYLAGINNIRWLNGSRIEKILAGHEAEKLFAQYYDIKTNQDEQKNKDLISKYQQADGGISILPYGESELELTALVCTTYAEKFDQKALANYLYRMLEKEDENIDMSLALWGLASLDEPVLQEINEYLTEEKLPPEVKIHLALASLDIGNGSYGLEIFKELLKDYGEDLGNTMRINVGRDQDEIIKATTQMAVLASRLNVKEKNKLYQYILENDAKETLNYIEQVQILKNNLKYMDNNSVIFTYQLGNKEETINLKDYETFNITLTKKQLTQIKFSDIKGKVGVITSYNRPYVKKEDNDTEGLSVKRTYLVNGKDVSTFNRSDLIKVVIKYKINDSVPNGMYEVVDVLPAGMSYVSRPYTRQRNKREYLSYPIEVKGQKLTFAVYKKDGEISYYARVISPGQYKAENTLFSSTVTEKYTVLGNEDRITIR